MPDITVAVRMDASNRHVLDYYLFPSLDLMRGKLRLVEDNGLSIDAYRFDDLGGLFDLAARIPFAEAA